MMKRWGTVIEAVASVCAALLLIVLALLATPIAPEVVVSTGPALLLVAGVASTSLIFSRRFVTMRVIAPLRLSVMRRLGYDLRTARRVRVGALTLLVAIVLALVLLRYFGPSHAAVVVFAPVGLTVAFIFFEHRYSAVEPIVRSDNDIRQLDQWASDPSLSRWALGRRNDMELSLLAGPDKGRGCIWRVVAFESSMDRSLDTELLGQSVAEHGASRREVHRKRLERASVLLGIPLEERTAWIAGRVLPSTPIVDAVDLEVDKRSRTVKLGWRRNERHNFYFLSDMLGSTDSMGTQYSHRLDPSGRLRKNLDLASVRAPCSVATVTVVVSLADNCVVGMERAGVASAFGDAGSERLPLHFVGEGAIPSDLQHEALSGTRNVFLRTAYRAVSEELGLEAGDIVVEPTGISFDWTRWQPLFTFVGYTGLSMAEISASARRSTKAHQTGQIVAIGWIPGDLDQVGRILSDAHPTLAMASNHAWAALALAATARDGATAVDARVEREMVR